MRFPWRSFALAALGLAVGYFVGRAVAPAADSIAAAASPHETPRLSLGAALAALAIALAAVALGEGVSRYQKHLQTLAIARALTRGDPERGPDLMIRYGCAGCHTIPGVAGADGQVGPVLSNLRGRVYLGGVVENTGDNLVRWITDPPSFSPRTAMPKTGVDEAEARQIAAWLYAN